MAGDLQIVPDDFTLSSFNFDFTQKSQSKGLIYFKEGYVHNISVAKTAEGTIIIAARCYRSMRKGESPHRMSIDFKGLRCSRCLLFVHSRVKIQFVFRRICSVIVE